jgi:hypothetical protein
MKNSPQPFEQNERRAQHAQLKSQVGNISEEQMLLDYLIDAGFMLDEALQLLNLREHLYSNTEMQQRLADDTRMQFARWLYEHGELQEDA